MDFALKERHISDINLQDRLQELFTLLPDGRPICRLFKTQNKSYIYDTFTNNVLECSDLEFNLLHTIMYDMQHFDELLMRYENNELLEAVSNLIDAIKEYSILKISQFASMSYYEGFEDKIQNELTQITIELTERCNLRCGYCIYHEDCTKNRSFGTRDISRETALKSIDYALLHSKNRNELGITFYGGEPLLQYELMKECIYYSLSKTANTDKQLSFSFTTNGVLLTKQIAEELAQIENLSILFSIDGPKEIHDLYRRDINGNGSFDRAMQGLQNFVTAAGDKAKDNVLISMVYAPPYTKEKLDKIQNFYNGLEWLPKSISKFVTYPSVESFNTIKNYLSKIDEIDVLSANDHENSLRIWCKENDEKENLFTTNILDDMYLRYYKRSIYHTDAIDVLNGIALNGCCLPGYRRIYITAGGEFKICERVGNCPNIGNVDTGVDIDFVKETFLDGFVVNSYEKCSKCWAARLCGLCYSHFYDEHGFNQTVKEEQCGWNMNSLEMGLVSYFEKLESNPNYFDYLEKFIQE